MFTLPLLIVSSSLAAPAPADAAKKALDELQGTWVAVALEEKGEKAAADDVKKEEISITTKGSELTVRHGKGEPDQFSFTLDSSKKPAQIDLKQLGDKAEP